MIESDERLQTNTYVWSQSVDQVTISFLVPDSTKARDLEIIIERKYLKAGLKGHEPVFQAELGHSINHFESLWQLEKNSISSFSSLTASPSLSMASSFAFMSSPTHSPNSSMILPSMADPVAMSEMSELLAQTGALSESDCDSLPTSPRLLETPPAFATTPPHLKRLKYRVLTIHLEKEDMIDWIVPVAGPYFKSNIMDITSSYLLGQWYELHSGDLDKAMDYFLSAAERGHTQSMLKVAAIYESNSLGTDTKKAFEWYKKAADNEVLQPGTDISHGPDPLACYIVGASYSTGAQEYNVEKDYQNALYYYNRCMATTAPRMDVDFSILDLDHVPNIKLRSHPPQTRDERYFCSSAFQTGLIYLYGSNHEGESVHSATDVEVDVDLAIRYWKEAALLGHAQACYNIGILYANGMGIDKDTWIAGKWFGRALKLDSSGSLVVPEGVSTIEWDEAKKEKSEIQTPENKKRKRRVKKTSDRNSDNFGAAVMLGSILAVAGTAWYFYTRWKRE